MWSVGTHSLTISLCRRPHMGCVDLAWPATPRIPERARQTYAVHNLPEFVGKWKADLSSTSFGSLKLRSGGAWAWAELLELCL